MKKFIIIILFAVLVMTGCKNANSMLGSTMVETNDQRGPDIFLNSLSVFKTDNNTYKVVITEDIEKQKTVEFSYDKKIINIQGLVLIEDKDISQYLGLSVEELEEYLGDVHADIGSGFYIPAYISYGGFIISFEIKDDIVSAVLKRDVITGSVTRVP